MGREHYPYTEVLHFHWLCSRTCTTSLAFYCWLRWNSNIYIHNSVSQILIYVVYPFYNSSRSPFFDGITSRSLVICDPSNNSLEVSVIQYSLMDPLTNPINNISMHSSPTRAEPNRGLHTVTISISSLTNGQLIFQGFLRGSWQLANRKFCYQGLENRDKRSGVPVRVFGISYSLHMTGLGVITLLIRSRRCSLFSIADFGIRACVGSVP